MIQQWYYTQNCAADYLEFSLPSTVHIAVGLVFQLVRCCSRSELQVVAPEPLGWYCGTNPMNTENTSKNTSDLVNPPKNAPKVHFSMLKRDENVSMAPHYFLQMRQGLHNFIQIGVNGSTISSLSASINGSNSEPLTPIGMKFLCNGCR